MNIYDTAELKRQTVAAKQVSTYPTKCRLSFLLPAFGGYRVKEFETEAETVQLVIYVALRHYKNVRDVRITVLNES